MSYESCAKHEGEDATNGCEVCEAEELETEMCGLDNFLAGYFGGDGTRLSTLRFLREFEGHRFNVVSESDGERLSPERYEKAKKILSSRRVQEKKDTHT
jgi:hypothetical protein